MNTALKVLGISVLAIIIAAGIAFGGYALANWHNSQKQPTTNNTANTTPDTPLTPAKPTTEPTCNADELSLAVEAGNAPGAGTLALNVVLTNTGARDCSLYGFPGVSLVNANGNQVGKPADRATNYTEKRVSLAPGAKTTAIVTYAEEGNFDAGVCTDGATKLRVYPPNDVGYLSVAEVAITDWCPGFATSPVQ